MGKSTGFVLDPIIKEIPRIHKFWNQDEKLVMQFDTFFSKFNLLVEDLKKLGLEQSDDIVAVTKIQEDGQRLEREIDRLKNDTQREEEKFADSIKKLFSHGLNFNHKIQSLDQLLKQAEAEESDLNLTHLSKAVSINETNKDLSPPQLPHA